MTDIHDELKRIAEGMGLGYYFGDWQSANYHADKWGANGGTFLLDILPVSGTLHIYRGTEATDEQQCNLAFLQRVPTDVALDTRGETTAALINVCKMDAEIFFGKISQSGTIEPINGDVPYTHIIEVMDETYTGVLFTVPLKPTQGRCIV